MPTDPPTRPATRRLLLADDQPALRKLVRIGLEHEGWSVREAGDGAQAWAALEAEPVDAALLDLQMPELSGAEVVARALASGAFAHVRFVLFTGSADRVSQLRASLPEVAVITKPFSFVELCPLLEGSTLLA